jgi:hypothetical protein
MINFEKEIAKYGNSLSELEKEAARRVFNELLNCGFTFEWLYYAVQRLDGRSIRSYPKLLFYHPFQEEVNEMVAAAHKEEEAKRKRNAEICAKIEAQIRLREEWERNAKIVFQPPKPKKVQSIDLAAIAEMEDED